MVENMFMQKIGEGETISLVKLRIMDQGAKVGTRSISERRWVDPITCKAEILPPRMFFQETLKLKSEKHVYLRHDWQRTMLQELSDKGQIRYEGVLYELKLLMKTYSREGVVVTVEVCEHTPPQEMEAVLSIETLREMNNDVESFFRESASKYRKLKLDHEHYKLLLKSTLQEGDNSREGVKKAKARAMTYAIVSNAVVVLVAIFTVFALIHK